MRYELVTAYALEHPWAMLPELGPVVAGILARHIVARPQSDEEMAAAMGTKTRSVGSVSGDVAVLPLYGVTFPRANMMSDMSGGASLEKLGRLVQTTAADESIGAIVLDADTPGGNVAGVTEFASIVRAAREQKPVIAVANHTMASAGYWIGASATEIVATPSARVGSIGVYTMHENMAAAMEKEGVERTLISSGKFKTEGHPLGPLDDEARANIQAHVDETAAVFHADVAAGRGVSAAQVRGGFGEGRTLSATDALAEGMIDSIGTLDETIARLTGRTQRAADKGRRQRATARALAGVDRV